MDRVSFDPIEAQYKALDRQLSDLVSSTYQRDSNVGDLHTNFETVKARLLKARKDMLEFFGKERDEDSLYKISKSFRPLLVNYFKFTARIMVVEFYNDFKGKSTDQLANIYLDRDPIQDAYDQWSIKIDSKSYAAAFFGQRFSS